MRTYHIYRKNHITKAVQEIRNDFAEIFDWEQFYIAAIFATNAAVLLAVALYAFCVYCI